MHIYYFKQKNILIIGASYGIGEALASNLANLGANLFLSARSKDKIEELSRSLDGNHFTQICDVTKKEQVIELLKIVKANFKKIDIIIFAAGIYEPMSLENYDQNKAHNILNVNFSSMLNFLDFFRQEAKENNLSQISIISSSAAYFGMPNSLIYGASKAALSHLTESLYHELINFNVKVQLINPGFVKTRLTDKNDFNMPNLITADQAAKIIIKALTKTKFEISFPYLFILMMKLFKFLPFEFRALLLNKMVSKK